MSVSPERLAELADAKQQRQDQLARDRVQREQNIKRFLPHSMKRVANSKYMPHQGKQEKQRRRQQIALDQIPLAQFLYPKRSTS